MKRPTSVVLRCLHGLAIAAALAASHDNAACASNDSPRDNLPGACGLRVAQLRCEYMQNPMGVDGATPRLFWTLESPQRAQRQKAYRVLVAASRGQLDADIGGLWDSGRVDSDRSTFVRYAGRQLKSRQQCWWKVQVWDQEGRTSQWSEPGTWCMGVLRPGDWKGKWIVSDLELKDYQRELRAMTDFGMEPETEIWEVAKRCREMTSGVTEAPAVYMRREFDVRKPVRRATACVCGLGMFELYVNGARVGDQQLDPAISDYDKRVLYVMHDVTAALRGGGNAVGVVLGNGWYNLITPHALRYYAADYIAPPRLKLDMEIEYEDGTRETVASDEAWRFTTDGPIRFNCVLAGETHDARREMPGWSEPGFDASQWKPVRGAAGPKGAMRAQLLPPVRVLQRTPATTVTRHGDAWRFDAGFEAAGWARVRLRGRPGQEITVAYPGSGSHTLGRYQTCKYICGAAGEGVLESRFSYNGFRHVEVTGLDYEPVPGDVEIVSVNTDMESVGAFACSDDRLNRLQDVLLRTIGNYVIHIPNDPTREKAGWTQDVDTCFHPMVYNFLAAPTFLKWQRDFLDAVHDDGYVPPVVPSRFDGPTINGPWWGGVVIYTPWFLYRFYGDRDILAESYPAMKKHFEYLAGIAKGGVIEWGLGDWMEVGSVRPVRTPVALTSTCAYYWFATILEKTARLLGKEGDARRYARRADSIRKAFNSRFLDEKTGQYALGSQTGQLLPLVLGLAPERHRDRIVAFLAERIERDGRHLSTGFVGTPFLLNGLCDLGRPDLAWSIATQADYPSFIDAILNRGQTVMKEDWKGGLVQMPTLQGPIGAWYYGSLAGIRPNPESGGFQRMLLKPETTGGLTWVKAHHDTLLGRVRSEWRRGGGRFTWDVEIPANTSATVVLPASDPQQCREGGRALSEAAGVAIAGAGPDGVVLHVGSGSYSFDCPG